MNRRDFFRSVFAAAVGAVVWPFLPKGDTTPPTHYDGKIHDVRWGKGVLEDGEWHSYVYYYDHGTGEAVLTIEEIPKGTHRLRRDYNVA